MVPKEKQREREERERFGIILNNMVPKAMMLNAVMKYSFRIIINNV